MYNLLFVLASPVFLGQYPNLESCQDAIYEIFATQMNPPGQRIPAVEQSIQIKLKYQKSYLCVPTKKI
jgi:hypothetical protein